MTLSGWFCSGVTTNRARASTRASHRDALMWQWRDTVEVPWASSLRAYNAMSPNNLLYCFIGCLVGILYASIEAALTRRGRSCL